MLRLRGSNSLLLRRFISSHAHKQCKNCQYELPFNDFYKVSKNKSCLRAVCKSCITAKHQAIMLGRFVNRARYQQNKWNASQSHKACTFDIDVEYLEHLYRLQNGKCLYSGMHLSMVLFSHWQCSLERTDPSIGYCKGNVALIILELNTAKQWSRKKVLQIPLLMHQVSIINNTEFLHAKTSSYKQPKIIRKRLSTDTEHYCYVCCGWKMHQHFANRNFTKCTKCRQKYVQDYERGNIRGFAIKKYHNAKRHAKGKKGVTEGCRKRNEFTLTINDIFDMLESQDFRCYYSGIPMSLTKGDWQWSPERIDNAKGYSKGNCVLICEEFQSVDFTMRASGPVSGSPQWNKSKFQQMMDLVQCLPCVVEQDTI